MENDELDDMELSNTQYLIWCFLYIISSSLIFHLCAYLIIGAEYDSSYMMLDVIVGPIIGDYLPTALLIIFFITFFK